MKHRYASAGVQTIGSPRMLNEVLTSTGHPVSAAKFSSRRWKRGLVSAGRRNSSLTDRAERAASQKELRDFGLIVGGICATLFGLLLPLLKHRAFPLWPWIAAAILIAPALAYPAALRGPYFLWTKLGLALGSINQRIVLTFIFYVIVMPIGLAMRLFGRDPMARRFEPARESYRVASRKAPPVSMDRPFYNKLRLVSSTSRVCSSLPGLRRGM
jgi:hypothetical protein